MNKSIVVVVVFHATIKKNGEKLDAPSGKRTRGSYHVKSDWSATIKIYLIHSKEDDIHKRITESYVFNKFSFFLYKLF